MFGGASSMGSGEHKSQTSLDSLKFYVIGRGRYKSFQIEASDDIDMRQTLPLECREAYSAIKNYLRNYDDDSWASFRDALVNQRQGGSRNQRALLGFQEDIWAPAVASNLESHTGLIGDEHNLQLTTGGSICFDVKVLKMMTRKQNDNLDLNHDMTRARAIEVLRILHTKIRQWPKEMSDAIFRGPEGDDGFEGIQSAESWPQNAADEPFSRASNQDFQYGPDYVDSDEGPTFRTTEKPWGLLVAIIKPNQEDEFADDNSFQLSAGAIKGGHKHNDMYSIVKKGPSNAFGTRKDLEKLEWVSNGRAAVGLKRSDGRVFIEAWKYDDSMPQMLKQVGTSFVVFVPPAGLAKTDGYYTSNEPNYDSLVLWATDFDAKALWPHISVGQKRTEKITKRLLGQGQHLDVQEFGHRGGHYVEIKIM
jgi:hypothetical protein